MVKFKKEFTFWSIIGLVGIVLAVLGFAFIAIGPVNDLMGTPGSSYMVEFGDLLYPLTIAGQETFTLQFVSIFEYLAFAFSILFVALAIVILVLSIIKKKYKLIRLSLVELVLGFFFVYFLLALAYKTEPLLGDEATYQWFTSLLTFDGSFSVGSSIFTYIFVLGGLLILIPSIVLVVLSFIEPTEYKVVTSSVADTSKEDVASKPTDAVSTKDEAVESKPKEAPKAIYVQRYDSYGPGKAVVENKDSVYPKESLDVKPLSRDDVRDVLREELAKKESEKKSLNPYIEGEVKIPEKKPLVEDAVGTSGESLYEEKEVPTPIIITIPKSIDDGDGAVEDKTTVTGLTKEEAVKIINEEINKALTDFKARLATKEDTIIVKVPRMIIKEKVSAPAPVAKTVVPAAAKAPEVVPAPVKEDETTEEEGETTKKIERISFKERIVSADKDIKDSYNELKSLLVSYGLNSRISNGGDTFRLHRVTYCKVTVAGKSLKLYLALDPKDYVNSTYPIKDSSAKEIYKEIPLVFKVKSGLSLRRAQQLIRDCMDKHMVEQIDQVKVVDWVSKLDEAETEADSSDD
jgi:hypothetical protein